MCVSGSDDQCRRWELCLDDRRSLCVEFDGTSDGDTAVYTTSSDYCIDTGPLERMCMDVEWMPPIIPDLNSGM